MNLVGKIFVGIITVMSVTVFALALVIGISHINNTDWRSTALEYQKTVDELQKVNSEITTFYTTDLNAELEKNQKAHQKVNSALVDSEKQLDSKFQPVFNKYRQNELDMQKTVETLTVAGATIDEDRGIIHTLSVDVDNSRKLRAAYLRDLAKTIGLKYGQESIITLLENKSSDTLDTLDQIKTVLSKNGLSPDPSLYPPAPQFIVNGIIENLQKDNGRLLMISVGAGDGLQPGHLLEVYRGPTYLGRIRVLTTEPNRSVCQVLPDYRRGTFREGDSVTSKLTK